MPKDTQKLKNLKHRCYIIRNLVNGKVYIGTTHKDIDVRFKEHIKVSNFTDKNKKQAIHKAIAKYGADKFSIDLLLEFDDYDGAYTAEIEYIQKYNSCNKKFGYNQSLGGDSGPLMIKYDRETIVNVLSDFCNGVRLQDISQKYNIGYHNVFDITRLRISITHNIPSELLAKLKQVKALSKKRKRVQTTDVISIISKFVEGETIQQLSQKYNLSDNNVWNIVHRNTWKEISIGEELETKLSDKLAGNRYWCKEISHGHKK